MNMKLLRKTALGYLTIPCLKNNPIVFIAGPN